ncbi:DUF4253 domain-containing protein [Streptomyces tailanensis]|uniref:DUF4253 domain-containing protein n=1 Tax=Streptomyces tailanensis TaxID=2569858 RepID=UPI00122E91E3
MIELKRPHVHSSANSCQLIVSVAAPPTTEADAEAVAAEHFAFCPDNIHQGTADGSLRTYVQSLLGEHTWSFWWD